jgi:predicted amino acid dehydrogenase
MDYIFQMIKDEKQAPVTISDDPKASAKEANVIFAATNDPNVFIFKEDMKCSCLIVGGSNFLNIAIWVEFISVGTVRRKKEKKVSMVWPRN